MPVYKYKTFEEAEQALWNFHSDERHFERVKQLWNFAKTVCPIRYPRGIFKFKTIEEANAHREAVELAHAKELRKARKQASK
jgi:hypothetical protein